MQDRDRALHFAEPPSRMTEDSFIERFGAIYEHSPWIARDAWKRGLTTLHDTVAGLAGALAASLAQAGLERQLALIRAHPDLAGHAAMRGELTPESSAEQASAGLDQCTADEFRRFQAMNAAYREKFDFPFVMAVRDSNRHAILGALEERLRNDPRTERGRALSEINQIARLRLRALTEPAQEPPR